MCLALAMTRAEDPKAAEVAQRAEGTADRRVTLGVKAILVHPEELENACFALMRALYRLERGEVDDARPDLERAAASSVESVYRDRAALLLEKTPAPTPLEPEPSTLAPHVLPGR